MKIIGLITEYNPLHNGHLYHMERARQLAADKYPGEEIRLVCVMSGDFTQRGIPAIVDKYARARMAVAAGVDAVFELPVRYACGSAELFAKGAVGILTGLGAVTDIVYGCEAADDEMQGIKDLAQIFADEPKTYKQALKENLKQGMNFPAARAAAALKLYPQHAELLRSPNNILGIEYEKAIIRQKSHIRAHGITRLGAGYFESGSLIREAMELGADLGRLMPPSSEKELTYRMELNDFSQALAIKLLAMDMDELCAYEDMTPEIAARVIKLRGENLSFSQLVSEITTRNLTETRVRRALMHVLLGLKNKEPDRDEEFFARLMDFIPGTPVLKEIKDAASIPIVTKLADAPGGIWDADDTACRIYNRVVFDKYGYLIDDDYTHRIK